MDYLQLIPSKTVAEHIRKVSYKLTSVDIACIVYNSDKTLKEKHKAYREIIATTPDSIINKNGDMLHDTLKQLILKEELYSSMLSELSGVCVNVVPFLTKDYYAGSESKKNDWVLHGHFSSYQMGLESFEYLPKEYLYGLSIIQVQILNDTLSDLQVYINPQKELCKIRITGDDDFDRISSLINNLDLHKKFPCPFQAGDIVKITTSCAESIVVYADRNGRAAYRIGGSNRLNCVPLRIDEFLNADYISKNEMENVSVIEKAVSAFLKHKIDLSQFLKIYDCSKEQMICFFTPQEKKHLKKFGIQMR